MELDDEKDLRLACLQMAIASCPMAPGAALLVPLLLSRAKDYEAYITKGDVPPKATLVTTPPGRA